MPAGVLLSRSGPPAELRVLWRRRWTIALTVLFTAAGGLAIAKIVPPVYESEVTLQIARAYGQPIEDPHRVVAYITSAGFRSLLGTDGQPLPARRIRAQVETGGPGSTTDTGLVEVSLRAGSAREAATLAERLVTLLSDRHHTKYAEVLKRYEGYRSGLDDEVNTITRDLEQLSKLQTELKRRPGGDGTASLLLNAQVEEKRLGLQQFRKEKRDLDIDQAVYTYPTGPIAPPTVPRSPIWPQPLLLTVVGAAVGLGVAIALVMLVAAREDSRVTGALQEKVALERHA